MRFVEADGTAEGLALVVEDKEVLPPSTTDLEEDAFAEREVDAVEVATVADREMRAEVAEKGSVEGLASALIKPQYSRKLWTRRRTHASPCKYLLQVVPDR